MMETLTIVLLLLVFAAAWRRYGSRAARSRQANFPACVIAAQLRERERYAQMLAEQRAEHEAFYASTASSPAPPGAATVHVLTVQPTDPRSFHLYVDTDAVTAFACSLVGEEDTGSVVGGGGSFGGAGASGDWTDD